ncbi:MAG: hypothetical protein F6K32_25155 [Desertifilum sp. SIO1I2]|nr:hypothetical protein [Desertifilum sp. SIO1I2]
MNIPPLVEYKTALDSNLPLIAASLMEYWLAKNGVFVRAHRQGIQACFPIVNCRIAGLAIIKPYFQMAYPRVPVDITKLMLQLAINAGEHEILFHLSFKSGKWDLEVPAQIATSTSVTPVGSSLGSSYERALIEVHSHPRLSSEFSTIDDGEETGFRLFAVLGNLLAQPEINTRLGIYSYFYSIPASWVFELPCFMIEKTG